MIRRHLAALLLAAALPLIAAPIADAADSAAARRPLKVDDLFDLKTVSDPQVSPDGGWVAFSVRSIDAAKDMSDTDLWMAPLAGGAAVRLTTSPKGESDPRWSPDGTTLAFLSGREGDHSQVWLLDRRGGEAVRLTDFKADVSELAWSPDGKRLALVIGDVDPDAQEEAKADGDDEKAPKPIVITRRQFKRDGEGYLRDLRSHVYVFDVAAKTSEQVTGGPYDDSDVVWSPDGKLLAFVSNRTADPDSNQNSDVYVVEPKAGATVRAVTTSASADGDIAWSPDGKSIAFIQGGDPADLWYGTGFVALAPVTPETSATGGAARPLTAALDRNAADPTFSADGKLIYFLLEDGGNQHLARVAVDGSGTPPKIERVVAGEREVQDYDLGPKGEVVVLESQASYPAEISRLGADGALARISRVNDAFLQGIRLGTVERFKAKSADGTMIDAFLTHPPIDRSGRLPTLLRIHGGPVAQFTTGFSLEWQMFAAHGYAVVAANPRGSSGYGRDFSRVLWADWGNKDFEDVMAAVDGAVAQGVADPDRVGVGGWSYGGILTNYVITKTGRFKAATSGASEVNYLANYGHDHYQYEWETELGLPWRNTDLWLKLSPWFQIDKVTTPTLVLCGQEDWNVPLINSEQLYQALRRLGRETELVIYPGQGHGITRPSYQKDRYERYLAWYDRFVKGEKTTAVSAP
jgi:dipeptidyl aminopeptidase/acylaminoacyl peptidase